MENLVKFDKLKADIAIYLQPAESMIVNSADTQIIATSFGKEVKSYGKRVEELRVELVKPLNDQVKMINDYAKELMKPLDKTEADLKKKLIAYGAELEKVRQEAMRKLQEEKLKLEAEAKKKADEERAAAEFERSLGLHDQAVHTETQVAITEQRVQEQIHKDIKSQEKIVEQIKVKGVKTIWKYEIIDEDIIPANYLMVDEVAIGKSVRNGVREIKGVRIYSEEVMAL